MPEAPPPKVRSRRRSVPGRPRWMHSASAAAFLDSGCLVASELRHRRVQRDPEQQQHQQGGAAADQHQPPADAAQHPRVARLLLPGRDRGGAGTASIGRGSSAIAETVADATHGPHQLAALAQLLAQVVDVGIDRVGRHGDPERPCMIEQLVARQRLPRDGAGSTPAGSTRVG